MSELIADQYQEPYTADEHVKILIAANRLQEELLKEK
jgi:hypothetical protein